LFNAVYSRSPPTTALVLAQINCSVGAQHFMKLSNKQGLYVSRVKDLILFRQIHSAKVLLLHLHLPLLRRVSWCPLANCYKVKACQLYTGDELSKKVNPCSSTKAAKDIWKRQPASASHPTVPTCKVSTSDYL